MVRKLASTGLVALFVAGTALAGGLPAQAAQVRPSVGYGDEIVYDYYSSAAHTTLVGVRELGSCGLYSSGTTSAYYTVNEYACPS